MRDRGLAFAPSLWQKDRDEQTSGVQIEAPAPLPAAAPHEQMADLGRRHHAPRRRLPAHRDRRSRPLDRPRGAEGPRSEEHTTELQSLMRTSYAVFCFKQKNIYRN